jgi:hypothetical protein
MRHLWMGAGLLAVSCLIAGCDSGSSSTVTPAEQQSAQDALKKWQEGHNKPTGKQSSGSTAADIANKKQRRH